MERTRRLRELWNWLPVFRAVAETEHLPTAASALFTSPASLSRTIGLLEENLGIALFDRVGRGLRLNASGAALLDSVRDGMRAIDEGVAIVDDNPWSGPIELWAESAYASCFLIPMIRTLLSRHPASRPSLQSGDIAAVGQRILRGQIDLALMEIPPVHAHLQVDVVQELHYGLYCDPSSALCDRDDLSLESLASEASFAVTRQSDAPGGLQRWPAHARPKSIVEVQDLAMASEACTTLGLVAALPGVVARGENLHRLGVPFAPKATLYAVYRKPVRAHPRTEALLEILQSQLIA
jgi:DNA-binding transcriptional LysR family regulator